jgi:hypothetical protein
MIKIGGPALKLALLGDSKYSHLLNPSVFRYASDDSHIRRRSLLHSNPRDIMEEKVFSVCIMDKRRFICRIR